MSKTRPNRQKLAYTYKFGELKFNLLHLCERNYPFWALVCFIWQYKGQVSKEIISGTYFLLECPMYILIHRTLQSKVFHHIFFGNLPLIFYLGWMDGWMDVHFDSWALTLWNRKVSEKGNFFQINLKIDF